MREFAAIGWSSGPSSSNVRVDRIASRVSMFIQSVTVLDRSPTRMQRSSSNACFSSRYFASVAPATRSHSFSTHVQPMSRQRRCWSIFPYRVLPITRSSALSTRTNGRETPRSCSSSALSTYATISSRVLTGGAIQRHNAGSKAASASCERCALSRGSSRTRRPSRTTGVTFISLIILCKKEPFSPRTPSWPRSGTLGFLWICAADFCKRPLRVVGGQHGPAPYRQVIAHLADVRKLPNQGSIKPTVHGFLVEDSERFIRGQRFPVGPVVIQCIVDVRNLQNARLQRDLLAIQAVGISCAIHS